jgi:hypothetical protein
MRNIPPLTREPAPAKSRELLDGIIGRHGDDVAELRAHGWPDRAVADVVGLVSLNLLTGAFNLVAGITPGTAAG